MFNTLKDYFPTSDFDVKNRKLVAKIPNNAQ